MLYNTYKDTMGLQGGPHDGMQCLGKTFSAAQLSLQKRTSLQNNAHPLSHVKLQKTDWRAPLGRLSPMHSTISTSAVQTWCSSQHARAVAKRRIKIV